MWSYVDHGRKSSSPYHNELFDTVRWIIALWLKQVRFLALSALIITFGNSFHLRARSLSSALLDSGRRCGDVTSFDPSCLDEGKFWMVFQSKFFMVQFTKFFVTAPEETKLKHHVSVKWIHTSVYIVHFLSFVFPDWTISWVSQDIIKSTKEFTFFPVVCTLKHFTRDRKRISS